MAEPTPDPVTAYLAEVRERFGARPSDVPRLLAAIEAVLEVADGWNIQAVILADQIGQVSPRNTAARVLLEVRSELRRICAETVRKAISAALLEASDD